ncbi:MAG: hypothetical protein HOO88_03935 [Kiritimatiellaceae bacterium]|nr:hypothetical protein [Kiritimatiellaceae bacterium]
MKKIVVVALILMSGSGYARTQVSLNIGVGLPIYYERPVYYTPVYYSPAPVYYEQRCYPAPVVVYVDRDREYRSFHGYGHHDNDGRFRGHDSHRH